VIITLGQTKLKTKHKDSTLEPVWDETFTCSKVDSSTPECLLQVWNANNYVLTEGDMDNLNSFVKLPLSSLVQGKQPLEAQLVFDETQKDKSVKLTPAGTLSLEVEVQKWHNGQKLKGKQDKLAQGTERLNKLKTDKEQTNKNSESLQTEIATLLKEVAEKKSGLEGLQKEQTNLLKELQEAKSKSEVVKNQSESESKKEEVVSSNLTNLQAKLANTDKNIKDKQTEINKITSQLQSLNTQIDALEKRKVENEEKYSSQLNGLQKQKDTDSSSIADLDKAIRQLETDISSTRSQVKKLTDEIDALRLESTRQELANLKRLRDTYSQELDQWKNKDISNKQEVEKLKCSVQQAKGEVETLKQRTLD